MTQLEPVEALPPVLQVEAALSESAHLDPRDREELPTLEGIKADNTPYPEDRLQAEQADAETEILHDLVEAAETPPPDEPAQPVEAEALAQEGEEPPQDMAPEPIVDTAILHDLVEATESVKEQAPPEPAVTAEVSPQQTRDLIDWHIAEAEPDQPPAIAEQDAPVAETVAPVPDEATAFAFAEADTTVKQHDTASEVAATAPLEDKTAKAEEIAPPGIAHIRNVIAEGRHWPDEATIAPDTNSGEIARSLLDIMSMPQTGSLPQERALAADTLLRLVPRLPEKSIIELVERVCVMEAPSQLLVRRLINDPRIEVSAPLLERGTVVSDRDLIAVIEENDPAKQRLIARRRGISPALAEALILNGDEETIINLLRNGQASFSIEAFDRLLVLAERNPGLRAALATRPDLPAPAAFELFWCLPSELRRYVLSRFLTDSETINKILKLSQITGSSVVTKPENSDLEILGKVIAGGFTPEATQLLAKLAGISPASAAKIAGDQGKEPLTVAMKAAGLSRSQFETLINRLLGKDENEPLKRIFDQLSFNKARVLLTYWDWAANHTGPYAKAAA
ncbi:MAG: DUF2336 domain-containing protein [Parvibaculaceae bacterium]